MIDSPDAARLWRLIRARPLFVALVAALPVVEYAAGRVGGPGPSLAVVRNPFAAIAAGSVFCRYILSDSRGASRKWIICLALATVGIGFASSRNGEPLQLAMMSTMFGLGVIGAVGFIGAALRSADHRGRDQYLGLLMDALLLPIAASMVSFGLWATGRLNPVYDTRIFAFEEILGAKFPLLGVRSYHLFGPLGMMATACYNMVALGIVLVAAAQKTAARERDVLTAAVVAGACGFALYFVCPVVGPFQAFGPPYPGAWPILPAGGALIVAALGLPRNGMPSLHTAWALLIWFNAQPLPPAYRRGLRLFVIMTLWATLGLEEHWLMDLVVGVPLAVAIQSALVPGEHSQRRWLDCVACGLLTGAWLIGFRTWEPLMRLTTPVAWLAVSATVCWPLIRQRLASVRMADSLEGVVAQHHPSVVFVDH